MARDVALVTGGSSGLGLAFARLLAGRGREVALVARDAGRLEAGREELVGETGAAVSVHALDLTVEGAPALLMERLAGQGMQVSLLVNNAGIGAVGPVVQGDPAVLERLLRLNVVAATLLARLAAEGMVQQGGGAIVNVCSLWSGVPVPRNAAYAASKAYLNSFSEALCMELETSGVAVLTLNPGQIVGTRFLQSASEPPSGDTGHAGLLSAHTADEVAALALRALEEQREVLVPGWRNRLFCAVLPRLPRALRKRILKAKYC